jgi:hypothetical protein
MSRAAQFIEGIISVHIRGASLSSVFPVPLDTVDPVVPPVAAAAAAAAAAAPPSPERIRLPQSPSALPPGTSDRMLPVPTAVGRGTVSPVRGPTPRASPDRAFDAVRVVRVAPGSRSPGSMSGPRPKVPVLHGPHVLVVTHGGFIKELVNYVQRGTFAPLCTNRARNARYLFVFLSVFVC